MWNIKLVNINLYNKYVDINNLKKINNKKIFTNNIILNNFNNNYNDKFIIKHNNFTYDLKLIDYLKLDISQYLLIIKDCIENKYILYTDNYYLKLLSFLFGCDLIFEYIENGIRYLKIYKKKNYSFRL